MPYKTVYVKIAVRIYDDVPDDEINEVIEEMDYGFKHPKIATHEIIDTSDPVLT